jgi:CheY-like chemotaxis protein
MSAAIDFATQSTGTVEDPARDEARDQDPEQLSARRRILVVDDNTDTADSLAAMLGVLGHEARVAYDGAQAIALADDFRPDIVLMDIGMPKFNGFQVAQRLRAQPWADRVVLIAITGWDQPEDRRCSKEAGFDAHLAKPVDPELLFRLLGAMTQPPSAVPGNGGATH